MRLLYWIINRIMLTSFSRENTRFYKALQDLKATQSSILFQILKDNSKTVFGRQHNFANISTVEEFQKIVPLSTYADYQSFIKRIAAGETGVLTDENVLLLEPSSGSTSPSKFIPYTKTLKQQFQKGLAPWLYDLYSNIKGVLWGKAYWSISPVAVNNERTEGGIPIGFEEDAQYLGFLQQTLIDKVLVVPKEIREIKEMGAFRYLTLLFLLKEKHLSLISVWNPSFLLLLMNSLDQWREQLIEDISNGTINPPTELSVELKRVLAKKLGRNPKRAEEIRTVLFPSKTNQFSLSTDRTCYEHLWPNLKLISCWTDANAAVGAKELQAYFPRVKFQGKGLLATEGLVSFPQVGDEGALLAANSHFYEFLEYDPENPGQYNVKLAYELEPGKSYSVVITTGGGLYRYKLQDLVKVIGYTQGCPRLIFIGKEDQVCDYCGEKLNELHVRQLLKELMSRLKLNPDFYMLAPEESGDGIYHYVLFLELDQKGTPKVLDSLMNGLERGLQENFHYRYCRDLGQLERPKLFIIKGNSEMVGTFTFHEVCIAKGQKAGDIKPTALHSKTGWSKAFPGQYIAWEEN